MSLGLGQSPISCLLKKTSGLDSSYMYLTQICLDSRAWDDQESVSPSPKDFRTMCGAVSGKTVLKGKYIMSLLTEKTPGIPLPCLCTSLESFCYIQAVVAWLCLMSKKNNWGRIWCHQFSTTVTRKGKKKLPEQIYMKRSLARNVCELLPHIQTRKACGFFYKVHSDKIESFLWVQIPIISFSISLSGKIVKKTLCFQYIQL